MLTLRLWQPLELMHSTPPATSSSAGPSQATGIPILPGSRLRISLPNLQPAAPGLASVPVTTLAL
eukprot:3054271-Amphidinium_carterae.1